MGTERQVLFMKRIFLWILSLLCLLGAMTSADAADQQAVNRRLGYFENTRTVLLLPAVYNRGGDEAADYVNREMNQIFRYPYYRTLDTADYAGKVYAPTELSRLADEAGADIVVMPVIQWRQWVYHRSFFMDADDIVETQATIDVYTYKKGEENTRDDRSRYWNREEEGMVRNRYILDDMMKQIFKTFPYRRVPTDISRNLSGKTVVDHTPVTTMRY